MRVISATANPDKLREISAILDSLWGEKVEVVERPSFIPETDESGATLEENAFKKAYDVFDALEFLARHKKPEYREVAEEYLLADPGEVTLILADDTGLEVEALDGAPGVLSARFAGEDASYEDNLKKLLAEMEGAQNRKARFATVVVALFLDGLELASVGSIYGEIATQPRGERGFGYDSVFIPDPERTSFDAPASTPTSSSPEHDPTASADLRTFAEMTQEEKDSLSHRCRALNSLKETLEQLRG